jgi:hypothetical protein
LELDRLGEIGPGCGFPGYIEVEADFFARIRETKRPIKARRKRRECLSLKLINSETRPHPDKPILRSKRNLSRRLG